MTDLKSAPAVPSAALWLGIAGILPFAAGTLQTVTGWPSGPRMIGPALYAVTLYGAVILSFMGGVQWGLAIASSPSEADPRRYGVSVLPACAAWAGLWLGGQSGLLLTVAGFISLLAYDVWTVSRGEVPAWYGHLRIGLTAAVVICLMTIALWGPF